MGLTEGTTATEADEPGKFLVFFRTSKKILRNYIITFRYISNTKNPPNRGFFVVHGKLVDMLTITSILEKDQQKEATTSGYIHQKVL